MHNDDDLSERSDTSRKEAYSDVNTTVAGNINILKERYCPLGTTAVAYGDDLQVLAVGQENGSVQLFERGEPSQLLYDYEMAQEAQPCTDIKVRASPKNGYHKTILVTYLGGHIKLWDTKIGKCLFTMKEKREIYGLNYHPKSNKFITVGNDFKLCLYDEERRAMERILACRTVQESEPSKCIRIYYPRAEIFGSTNGHTGSVCSAKFHPKNPFEIISCGLDSTIQFWDLRAPYAVRHISNIINYGEALDISHDGKIILAGVSNNRGGALRIYDYDTGAKIKENNFFNTYVYCCRFLTPSFVGMGGFLENSFHIVNINSGEVLGSVTQLPGCVMSFASKQKILQQRTSVRGNEIPVIVLSSAEKILELGARSTPEECEKL